MARKQKADAEALARAELQERAVSFRLAGMNFSEIGRQMGVAKSTAHRLVTEAIAAHTRDSTETLIDLELQRLDIMQRKLWSKVLKGDDKAVAAVLRIMERRARYYALDQYALGKLATDTRSLAAVDAWAKAMLGRDLPADVDAMPDDDLDALITAELGPAADTGQ